MTGHALTCERCGDALEGSYRTQTYSGVHQLQSIAPDGGSTTIVAGAILACSWNCLAVLAAQRAGGQGDAAVRMVAERERQITQEGYSPERDASMPPGELAGAGVCYAAEHSHTAIARVGPLPAEWPWDAEWWKPKGKDRDLIRAGALIAAEADRDPNRRSTAPGEPF